MKGVFPTADDEDIPKRSYGCSNGDGNPYDFVVVTITDASTLFLCASCFIQTAQAMLMAMVEPENPEVQRIMAEAGEIDQVPMNGRQVAKRGHEAPAEVDDPDAIDAFDSYVLDDEVAETLGL